jgi:hypothetical protein
MFESKLKKSVKVADRINPCVVSSLICVQKRIHRVSGEVVDGVSVRINTV